MFWRYVLLGWLFALASCKATQPNGRSGQQESIRQRYDVEIQFASVEDVKRVPYRLTNLRMELREELSAGQHIYLVSIECRPHALEGVLEKLNTDEGIIFAKPRD